VRIKKIQKFWNEEALKNEVFVDSGEVAVCQGTGMLIASAIGSCVVVTVYDPFSCVGGMAHVMLPWASRDPHLSNRTKYAEDAMKELMRKMADYKTDLSLLKLCLIGGGNLLGDGHDDIGADISRSLIEIITRMGIKPIAMELGGLQRRSCALCVSSGRVTFTVGNSAHRTLMAI
jgi:chemotaxis protein CheD